MIGDIDTSDRNWQCCYCGMRLRRCFESQGRSVTPEVNDMLLCGRCGEVSIADHGFSRKPTALERFRIEVEHWEYLALTRHFIALSNDRDSR